jgi:hypothetical protein
VWSKSLVDKTVGVGIGTLDSEFKSIEVVLGGSVGLNLVAVLEELAKRVKELVTGENTGVVICTVLGGKKVVVMSRMVAELSSIVIVGDGGIEKSSTEELEVSDPTAGRLLTEGVGVMCAAVKEVEKLAPGS